MKIFESRALGAGAGPARSGSAAAFAKDLVQRTLAQHGLVPPSDDPAAGMRAPKAGWPRPVAGEVKSRSAEPLPTGASFVADQFSCDAGARRFLTYVPASAPDGLQGLIVMLHGCTQTPEDFAAGTQMNALAEKHRLVIVYPHQSRGENAQSCWNWFRRGDQMRDRGEPAILAGLAKDVAVRQGVPAGKIFVAGLSAGGAMAAIVGEAYPEVFAAVGVHSGLPVGSAKDVASAFAAMAGNPMPPAGGKRGAPTRTIVLHGTADGTVHPGNADEIVRQVLHSGPSQTLQVEDRGQAGARRYTRRLTTDSRGVALAEHWEIEALGHAWSGGSPEGTYTDSQGPDASAEMVRFFLE